MKKFKTATDFRRSLEDKLKKISEKQNIDLQRLRRKVAFDRFLARIFSSSSLYCLKGGYALELTFANSRTTKDIDLVCLRNIKEMQNEEIYHDLSRLAEIELGDYFHFQILAAQMPLTNTLYGGARFPITCIVDDRLFVNFKIDVAIDLLPPKTRVLEGENWLDFIEITPPEISMISLEQQFAEKIHAYTFPREIENSRVKDLVDLLLILKKNAIKTESTRELLNFVFKNRNSHQLPKILPKPLDTWDDRFKKMANECDLSENIQTAYKIISKRYEKILEAFLEEDNQEKMATVKPH